MSNEEMPFDVSTCDNPVLRDAFCYFSRHLVCLGGTLQDLDEKGNQKGQLRPFACSAFILVIRDNWYLLTAGHCLKNIDYGLKKGLFRLIDSWIICGFGPKVTAHSVADQPIYFDYVNTWKDYLDQYGLDFGLLELGGPEAYLRKHIEMNEVVPVQEENWRLPPNMQFDFHVVVGFPQEFVMQRKLWPTMVYVHSLDEMPKSDEPNPYRTFAGRLGDKLLLKSMDGMSGGPIFGFKRSEMGRYWVVAIQNEWNARRKLTFGCSVPQLAHFAEMCLHGLPKPMEE